MKRPNASLQFVRWVTWRGRSKVIYPCFAGCLHGQAAACPCHPSMHVPRRTRRGVILPAVLAILLLLGLLVGMFTFRVNADLAATQAVAYRLQARLAAEAGVEAAKLLLRTSRSDVNRWYNNPDELNRIIVWANGTDPTVWGTNEPLDAGATAYRFSIVADDPTDDEKFIRFGMTDASAKLNLNTADEDQLLTLAESVVVGVEQTNPQEIVDAILDWRDPDSDPRGENGDTEDTYYRSLDKPYRVKNGPFDTVEELLLVKGVTPEILFGEDFDRNGLLTPNEDDGDDTFPPDNADGQLNRGLYPYLTVLSYETNVSNSNRPRIYLFGEENQVREQLSEVFEDEPEIVNYIVDVTRSQGGSTGTRGGRAGQRDAGGGGDARQGTGSDANTDTDDSADPDKSGARRQRREDDPKENTEADSEEADGSTEEQTDSDKPETETEEPQEGDEQAETGDAVSGSSPIRSPASLLLPRSIRGEVRAGPIGIDHLATLLDRTTTIPPQEREVRGLIDINTAPPAVLRCIKGLTGEQIAAIMDVRRNLDSETKATPAWLVTEEVVDLVTFEQIAPQITARGQQFTIESLGYADHIGMVVRLQVIIDMVGPIAQTIYYRDLTHLGGQYPIREEDRENIRVQ